MLTHHPRLLRSIMIRTIVRTALASLLLLTATAALQARDSDTDSKRDSGDEVDSPRILKNESQTTSGFITIKGAKLAYLAEAGVQVVFLKDPKDDDPQAKHDDKSDSPPIPVHAAMSYVAYS